MTPPRRLPHAPALALTALLTLGLALSGCAGSDGDESSSGPDSSRADAGAASAEAPADAPAMAEAADRLADTSGYEEADLDPASTAQKPEEDPSVAPALVRTGTVALEADDVDAAAFEVGKVVDAAGGKVAEENSAADDDGALLRTRIVYRIPVAEFDTVVADLKKIGRLLDATTRTEDVTTQVIDTGVRIDLQRRSIRRIGLLLERATSIPAIVRIESELSRREAALGSLLKRQDYLADQTDLSTITVSIQQPPPPKEKKKETADKKDDEQGFLAGLEGGWDAFTGATTALLTATGAVLPFALLGLVVAVPLRLVLRRRRATASPAAD